MKKAITFILAVFYLSTSMGATLHLHYCMGRLVDWGLQDLENRDCTFCGMPKFQPRTQDDCTVSMKGCCHDEHKHLKNGKDQKATQTFLDLSRNISAVANLFLIIQGRFINSLIVEQPEVNSPPLPPGIPLYLRNSNFRI